MCVPVCMLMSDQEEKKLPARCPHAICLSFSFFCLSETEHNSNSAEIPKKKKKEKGTGRNAHRALYLLGILSMYCVWRVGRAIPPSPPAAMYHASILPRSIFVPAGGGGHVKERREKEGEGEHSSPEKKQAAYIKATFFFLFWIILLS